MKVDLIIFRIPDEDGDMLFVQLDYVNGVLSSVGKKFTVLPDNDSYREMRFDHIVLAAKIPIGSRDLTRFAIGKSDDNSPETVYEIPFDELQKIVDHLVKEYQSIH